MSGPFVRCEPRPQARLERDPYDTWLDPSGQVSAQFVRHPGGFLVRFIEEADFEIDAATLRVRCFPVPGPTDTSTKLYHNSIDPLLANYRGELNLHASAAVVGAGALGFVGPSRRGKTTLAGAFARAGHAFLTEDVLRVEERGEGFHAFPSRPELRLFHDSAVFLAPACAGGGEADGKTTLATVPGLPHHDSPVPLAALFLLGPGATAGEITLQRLSPADALAGLARNSFILDVEDRKRLAQHFSRLGTLAEKVPCYSLDYPRAYDHIPTLLGILTRLTGLQGGPRNND